jgi:hypothetical protein
MAERGIDPAAKAIHVSAPVITADRYGAVPLTVSARRDAPPENLLAP